MQEIVEVSESEPVVDHPSQDVLLRAEQARQPSDRQRFTRIQAFGHEVPVQAIEHALLQPAERDGGRRIDRGDPVDDPQLHKRGQRPRTAARSMTTRLSSTSGVGVERPWNSTMACVITTAAR